MQSSVLFIGDPLNSLAFSSDSSLALAEAALYLGHQVHWTTPEQLLLANSAPSIQQFEILKKINPDSPPNTELVETKSPQHLSAYQKIFVRKDPPFDENYTELCWILQQISSNCVINSPQALLTHHEKMLPFTLMALGIVPDHSVVPSFVAQESKHIIAHAERLFDEASHLMPILTQGSTDVTLKFKVLVKPWRGHGGRGIQVFSSVVELENWLLSLSKSSDQTATSSRWIIQPFLPEIFTHGDRRVFVAHGQVVFDFVRRPAQGRVEANLAQGGSAHLEPLSEVQSEIANSIAAWLQKEGIVLAGLDFIGDFLTEVNITSPTGIRTFEHLSRQNVSIGIMQKLLSK
jgi:glutathione synthase